MDGTQSRLTILRECTVLDKKGHAQKFYLCRCSCGKEKQIFKYSVDSGATRSCGCLRKEISAATTIKRSVTHGDASRRNGVAPEYDCWRSMLKRCYDPKHQTYPSHGGRGISVCEEWRNSYESFLSHIGRRPSSKYTVDRINNDGNYEPGNVRWATPKEQGRNKRTNRMITYGGKTQCVSAWAEEIGMDRHRVLERLKLGWPEWKAIGKAGPPPDAPIAEPPEW